MYQRVLTARNGVSFAFGMKLAVSFISLASPYVYILSLMCVLGLQTFSEAVVSNEVSVNESSNLTLKCKLSGFNFSWTRLDKEIHLPYGNLLPLDQINRSSAGQYKCCNKSSVCQTFKVVVNYPANGTIQGSRQIQPGGNISLRCKGLGVPPVFNISWYFEGVLLQKENNENLSKVASCETGGRYTCSPKNILGTASNGTADVKVAGTPQSPKLVNITEHGSGSNRSLNVTWLPGAAGCNVTFNVLLWSENRSFNVINQSNIDKSSSRFANINNSLFDDCTGYNVSVRAVDGRFGASDFSNGSILTTLSEAPEPPRDAKAMPVSGGTIQVTWKAPRNVNQCVVSYQVFYRRKGEEWKNTKGTRDTDETLSTDHSGVGHYEIRIKAFVDSKESNFSATLSVKFEDGGNSATLIILGVVLGVFLVVGVIGLALLLRSRRRRLCCLSAHCIGFFSVPNPPSPPSPTKRPSIKTKRGPVCVDSFAAHLSYLHTDGDYRFDQEFETLRGIHVRGRSWLHNDKGDNQGKNRYANIVAYDQSRVVLSLTEEDPESHYINANYVDSYNQINAYIATQGPMANTIGDFWRMVWEQNCSVIVMITNIIEKGRHKCAMYWPSKQAKSEIHGPLRITHLGEETFAHYTVRRFEVKPSDHSTHYSQDFLEKEVEPMIVTQYHFTGWPDHGAPDVGCEYPALDFILRSAAANRNSSGPIVVHCSAGVGRSGAYIVIHSMVKRMHETGDLDIFDFLCHIRQQRNHLVQEECQYMFVHDALLHYIESDFKIAIPVENLKDHVHKLRRHLTNPSNGKNRLEVECEKLNAIQVKNYNLKQAKRACNAVKNRSMKCIPADSTRMELFPRPREEGSDYINASFLDGFWKAGAYIATQAPLENTADDFWRMIWQENSRSVVMLVSKDELQQGYFPSYLPALYDMARYGKFEVAVDSEIVRGDIVVRDLRMVSIQDPSEVRKIRHFHFLHWPEDGTPWSGQTILQLIDKVDSWEKEVRANAKPFELIGAIVVHCNYGVGRTGAYCLLHTMYHQIARENTVSIYQIARLYNYQRPHCLQNQEQYAFCYDTLVEYIEADCSLYLV